MTGPSAASMWPEWLRGSALGCDGASPARPSRPSALLHDDEANAPGDRAAQLVGNGARCLRNALDRQADAPQHDRIARACVRMAAQVDGHQVHRNAPDHLRSEEHTSELQSLMRISYAVFCLKKKNNTNKRT